jgi:hypothetical protein
MNETSTTHEKAALTPAACAILIATPAIHVVGRTSLGVEIVDTRSLMARLEAPIKGKGVVRYFGDTQKIITPAYAARLGL